MMLGPSYVILRIQELKCKECNSDGVAHYQLQKHEVAASAVILLPCSKDTVNILKFGTPQTIAIIVLKTEKFDVTLH